MVLGETYVLSLIYSYVADVCSVQYVLSLLFASVCYFLITRHTFLNILFILVFCFLFLFSVLCVLCFLFTVLCIVSPYVYSYLFPILIQVYPPLPPAGNPTAVNKYHIIYHVYLHWQTCLVFTYTMHRALNAYWYTRA